MKNIKLTILGVTTLLFALTLNFRHALDDYGVLKNKLHVEVLAQSNNSGGSGSSSVNWNHWTQWPSQGLTKDEETKTRDCESESSSSGSGSVSVGYGGVSGSISGSGSTSQTNPSGRVEYICIYGNQNCTPVGC